MEIVFGKRVAELRKEHGWSQSDLAERVGLSWGQVSRYERGISTPAVDVIQRFADVLGVADGELMERVR